MMMGGGHHRAMMMGLGSHRAVMMLGRHRRACRGLGHRASRSLGHHRTSGGLRDYRTSGRTRLLVVVVSCGRGYRAVMMRLRTMMMRALRVGEGRAQHCDCCEYFHGRFVGCLFVGGEFSGNQCPQ